MITKTRDVKPTEQRSSWLSDRPDRTLDLIEELEVAATAVQDEGARWRLAQHYRGSMPNFDSGAIAEAVERAIGP